MWIWQIPGHKANRDRLRCQRPCDPALYGVLLSAGFSKEELKTFRHLNTHACRPSQYERHAGVDMSTGSLVRRFNGQAALAAKKFGDTLSYVRASGDGDWRKVKFGRRRCLPAIMNPDNLTLIIDNNGLQRRAA